MKVTPGTGSIALFTYRSHRDDLLVEGGRSGRGTSASVLRWRRSRFFEKVVGAQIASSMLRPTNQRNSRL